MQEGTWKCIMLARPETLWTIFLPFNLHPHSGASFSQFSFPPILPLPALIMHRCFPPLTYMTMLYPLIICERIPKMCPDGVKSLSDFWYPLHKRFHSRHLFPFLFSRPLIYLLSLLLARSIASVSFILYLDTSREFLSLSSVCLSFYLPCPCLFFLL